MSTSLKYTNILKEIAFFESENVKLSKLAHTHIFFLNVGVLSVICEVFKVSLP